LFGDYKNGLDYKSIRWMTWTFDIDTVTIALFNTNQLAIGSIGLVLPFAVSFIRLDPNPVTNDE